MNETPFLRDRDHLIEKFHQIPLLSSFSESYLQTVVNLSKIRMYQAGEEIIPEGSKDQWVYIIISGSVKVTRQGEEITTLDHPGDIFGEMAMIDGAIRSASVSAATNTVCLAMDTNHLENCSPEEQAGFYSVFYRLFAELLVQRLRKTTDELASVKEQLEKMKSA